MSKKAPLSNAGDKLAKLVAFRYFFAMIRAQAGFLGFRHGCRLLFALRPGAGWISRVGRRLLILIWALAPLNFLIRCRLNFASWIRAPAILLDLDAAPLDSLMRARAPFKIWFRIRVRCECPDVGKGAAWLFCCRSRGRLDFQVLIRCRLNFFFWSRVPPKFFVLHTGAVSFTSAFWWG